MRKGIFIFTIFITVGATAVAATNFTPKRFINTTSNKDAVPYLLNNKKNSNISDNSARIKNTFSNTSGMNQMGRKKVVKRQTNARSATNGAAYVSATPTPTQRSVVQRPTNMRASATNVSRTNIGRNNPIRSVVNRNSGRTVSSTIKTSVNVNNSASSSRRCFAEYKECMEDYCKREDTAYNRCYCSAKLAQIDSRYQNKIDSLIQQIIKLQYNSNVSDEEIKSYWDATVGQYTGTNPFVNIDNALNINWANNESRVRGQNAFNIGHEYCSNYLKSCSYMASNMRDSYKAEIAKDCATYEDGLQKIQQAAESVIESYND